MIGTTVEPSHEPPHERKGGEKTTKPRGRRRGKWLKEPSTEKKLNAPMNHMIDLASYWACACQRLLTSRT